MIVTVIIFTHDKQNYFCIPFPRKPLTLKQLFHWYLKYTNIFYIYTFLYVKYTTNTKKFQV